MSMCDLHMRIVDRLISFMNASGQIDIFKVHEESFVEETTFQQRSLAQQHETAGKIRHREHNVGVDIGQLKQTHPAVTQALEYTGKGPAG